MFLEKIIPLLREDVLKLSPAFPDSFGIEVPEYIRKGVLMRPIMDAEVFQIPIQECSEELVDLSKIDHGENAQRFSALSDFGNSYESVSYDGNSKVRQSVYQCLLNMLKILPKDIGIAYFEGFRPLEIQKRYFDKKFIEILKSETESIRFDEITDAQMDTAYHETSKHVSPFIDNTPTHSTGAAIDIHLYKIDPHSNEKTLLDLGKFDVIFGPNNEQETFCSSITKQQKKNRLMLLDAAIKSELVNYGYEWWHFSFGDKLWAYVKGEACARYGCADNNGLTSLTRQEYFKRISKNISKE
jgi:D-alanyl-D-alanine dipeptidase